MPGAKSSKRRNVSKRLWWLATKYWWSIFSLVTLAAATEYSCHSFMKRLAMLRTSLLIVAEKSQVRFSAGVFFSISSISSRKPMFSISSASSSITYSRCSSEIALRSSRSINLLGVGANVAYLSGNRYATIYCRNTKAAHAVAVFL